MAFKGGTSLSKVYGAIDQFSEDIDVTVATESSPTKGSLPSTRNQADKLRASVANELDVYLREHVQPLLDRELTKLLGKASFKVATVDRETIILEYPSIYSNPKSYLQERVKLEFGARNSLVPNESHIISSYIESALELEVTLPKAHVDVLFARRTFWEKATLAHDMCNREQWVSGADRSSRHWYDLAKLADHPVGKEALKDRALLEDVVEFKGIFFKRSTSRYEDCLSGRLRLTPSAEGCVALKKDYEEMGKAGMFSEQPPTFDELMDRIERLERIINE